MELMDDGISSHQYYYSNYSYRTEYIATYLKDDAVYLITM